MVSKCLCNKFLFYLTITVDGLVLEFGECTSAHEVNVVFINNSSLRKGHYFSKRLWSLLRDLSQVELTLLTSLGLNISQIKCSVTFYHPTRAFQSYKTMIIPDLWRPLSGRHYNLRVLIITFYCMITIFLRLLIAVGQPANIKAFLLTYNVELNCTIVYSLSRAYLIIVLVEYS